MAENKDKENLQFTETMAKVEQFAKALDSVLAVTDLTTSTTKAWTVFSKDSLRQYLQSPYSSSSQTQLRNLARFLSTLSFPLRRLISYFASLPDLSVYKVLPKYNLIEDNDEEALLQDFENVCRLTENMDLAINFFKVLSIAWREGICYYYPYQDTETGELLLMPLDGQYCKVSGVGYNNLLHVAFDFSFFNGTNTYYLDIWAKEFKQKYNKYQSDSSLRWQELDEARALKIDIDNTDLILSPFVSLFESIIDLIDLQALTAVRDALDVYKLLVMKIPMLDSNTPDDMALNLKTAQKFFNKMVEGLDEGVAAILSPMDIEPISFEKSNTSNTNAIADTYRNVMEQAGVSQIMDASRLSGQAAVKASMLCDVLMGTKGIIPQIEAFVNERIQLFYPDCQVYVKFTDTTIFTKDDRIKQLQSAAEYGLPVKMELMSALGYSPLEAIGTDWLETKLGLATTKFATPLKSSHTTSGSAEGGAPTKDDDELSDEGADTKDKGKNDA